MKKQAAACLTATYTDVPLHWVRTLSVWAYSLLYDEIQYVITTETSLWLMGFIRWSIS
jgi:hypothetical protein